MNDQDWLHYISTKVTESHISKYTHLGVVLVAVPDEVGECTNIERPLIVVPVFMYIPVSETRLGDM